MPAGQAFLLFPFARALYRHPFGEYVYQVIVINIPAASSVVGGGNRISSILYSLLYPILLFFHGKWSYLRLIEIGIASFFGLVWLFGGGEPKIYSDRHFASYPDLRVLGR